MFPVITKHQDQNARSCISYVILFTQRFYDTDWSATLS